MRFLSQINVTIEFYTSKLTLVLIFSSVVAFLVFFKYWVHMGPDPGLGPVCKIHSSHVTKLLWVPINFYYKNVLHVNISSQYVLSLLRSQVPYTDTIYQRHILTTG